MYATRRHALTLSLALLTPAAIASPAVSVSDRHDASLRRVLARLESGAIPAARFDMTCSGFIRGRGDLLTWLRDDDADAWFSIGNRERLPELWRLFVPPLGRGWRATPHEVAGVLRGYLATGRTTWAVA